MHLLVRHFSKAIGSSRVRCSSLATRLFACITTLANGSPTRNARPRLQKLRTLHHKLSKYTKAFDGTRTFSLHQEITETKTPMTSSSGSTKRSIQKTSDFKLHTVFQLPSPQPRPSHTQLQQDACSTRKAAHSSPQLLVPPRPSPRIPYSQQPSHLQHPPF